MSNKNIICFQRDLIETETNSCLIVYYQSERLHTMNKLFLNRAEIFLHEPLFSDLRTE